MSGMNHLILYTLSCELSEEEKSINASEIFLETNSRALEAVREWFSEGSIVSVPDSSGSRGPNPPSTWLLPVPVRAAKIKFHSAQSWEV